MKRLLSISLLALGFSGVAMATTYTGDLVVVPKTEEFVLGGTRHFDFQAIGRGLGSRVVKSMAGGRILVVRPPKGRDWRSYRQELLAQGTYHSVEPDTYSAPSALADDPSLPTQWHLYQISAPRVWDYSDGSTAPILAVVDGGVDLTHPDLAQNLVPGYNTISGLAQGAGGLVSDVTTSGHGTRVAGIAGAKGNNALGVSSVGWNLRIMPVRATDAANGVTPRSELIEGATWAIQNGAKVVNVSYTDVQFEDIETLGAWARTQGALVVWSAGNSNTNWANFDHDNVTVVGGTDQSDQRWAVNTSTTGSGYGKGVDCFAPANLIYTTRKGAPWYGYAPAGVSFAVPQVAATLALMMGRFPTLSPTEIERRMLLRCSNMGPLGNDITFGYGRLNAGAAVEWPIRKYSLEALPTTGIPNVLWVYPSKVVDDGTVYGVVYRTGQSCVLARWRDGALLDWRSSETLFGVPAIGMVIDDVNENGVVVGQYSDPTPRGFMWNPTAGTTLVDVAGYPRTYWTGINNSGDSVGFGQTSFVSKSGRFRSATTGILTNPIESPPLNIPTSNAYYKLAEDGTIVGIIQNGSDQPFLLSPVAGLFYCEMPAQPVGSIQDATEEGAFVGNWTNLGSTYFNYAHLYNAKGKILRNFGVFTYPAGMNESLEVVGADLAGDATVIGGQIFYGYNPGPIVEKLTPLPNDPNNTLPLGITLLRQCMDVNNVGQITVQAETNLNTIVGFLANPVDTPGLGVSLGQLGSSPTYIGSIPPALSVTFCNDAGTPYPNATVLNDYRGGQGIVNIDPPATVTGNYRVYLRCNSTVIPDYTGPKFLNRMYPPLGTPPAPRDSFYLPFSGATTITGTQQPVLEMYPGDVDESGEIDAADIDIVIANFGFVSGQPEFNEGADVDGSGEIDAADIDIVIANFGLTDDPEP